MSIVIADLSLRYCPGMVVVIVPRTLRPPSRKALLRRSSGESASTLRLSHPSPCKPCTFYS